MEAIMTRAATTPPTAAASGKIGLVKAAGDEAFHHRERAHRLVGLAWRGGSPDVHDRGLPPEDLSNPFVKSANWSLTRQSQIL
jgi:hypothetical protein